MVLFLLVTVLSCLCTWKVAQKHYYDKDVNMCMKYKNKGEVK